MKKRIFSMLLAAALLFSLVPVLSTDASAATSYVTSKTDSRIEYMLKNIEYQNFSGSGMTSEQVKAYIRHFMFDASFAAIGGGSFNYPNSGSYAWEVTDGTYTRSIRGSTGCCAYCYFVSKVIYGKDWVDPKQQTVITSASQLKSFLLTYGQAGEHLRADPSHSVTFISADDAGFYCFSYCGDNNPRIRLDYWTYEAYMSFYSGRTIYVYNVFNSDNSSTRVCINGHSYNNNVVTAPTETSAGKLRCYCPVCKSSKDVTLPKLSTADYTLTTQGVTTCTTGAVKHYTWKVTEYGTISFDVQQSAGNHNYVYSLAAEPTESADGSVKGVCSKCKNTVYITMPKLNYSDYTYTPPSAEPKCTEGCSGTFTWNNTQYGSYHFAKYLPAQGHNYCMQELNSVTKAPTETAEGTLVCHCLKCNHEETITLPKLSNTDEYSYAVTEYATRDKKGTGVYTWLVDEFGEFTFEVAEESPFCDVPKTANYYKPILWLYYHEPIQITAGTDATHFSPNESCTRAQVVTFLWRAAGCPSADVSSLSKFTDGASIAKPYRTAVAWAIQKGITSGFGDGSFRPDVPVSRAQFVTFLYRYEGSPATNGSVNGFADAGSIASGYKTAIAWAVAKGVTSGYGDNTFRPNATCTRWAVAIFMQRDLDK